MARYRVSTLRCGSARQTSEDVACDDEASAFLAACAGLAPGERRELRHGARLIAVLIGPRTEQAKPKAIAAPEPQA